MFRIGIALLGLTLMAGCGSSMQSIEMKGNDNDLMRLAGDWEGEYEVANETKRTGKIVFHLDSGRHVAEGKVLMYPAGVDSEPEPLKVKFVRVENGELSGTLDPYLEPQCKCQAKTTFTGSQLGEVISGTFTIELPTLKATRSGTWRVTRKK